MIFIVFWLSWPPHPLSPNLNFERLHAYMCTSTLLLPNLRQFYPLNFVSSQLAVTISTYAELLSASKFSTQNFC